MSINKYDKEGAKEKSSSRKNSFGNNIKTDSLEDENWTKEYKPEEYFMDDIDDYSDPPLSDEQLEGISFNYSDDGNLKFDYLEDKQFKRKRYKNFKSIYRRERIINCPVVIAKLNIRKVGTLEITAPIGLGIDINTGKLSVPVKLEAVGEPVFKPRIIKNTLINEGYIPSRIIVEPYELEHESYLGKCFSKLVYIPFQSDIKINGIKPDDTIQEKVEFQSLSVFGFPDTCLQNGKGTITKLVLKVILNVKILISRECLLAVVSRTCNSDY